MKSVMVIGSEIINKKIYLKTAFGLLGNAVTASQAKNLYEQMVNPANFGGIWFLG